MWLMNASVQTVDAPGYRNGDIREAALDHWSRNFSDCVPVVGLDAAPEPFPTLIRECIAVIGRETRRQVMAVTRRQPDLLVARGGTSSDALGFFTPFVQDGSTRLVCVSPDGQAAAALERKTDNVFDPLQQPLTAGEQAKAKTILEGLEYPAVMREQQWLHASGRVESPQVTLDAAKEAIRQLSHAEGLIPALDTAHSLGWAFRQARTMRPDQSVVVMFAEDSAKDLWDLGRLMGVPF
jgi:tryptophan synthase beta chain